MASLVHLTASTNALAQSAETSVTRTEVSAQEQSPREDAIAPDEGETEADAEEAEADVEEGHLVTLGLRGFAGALTSKEESSFIYGGGLVIGAPVYRSLELEGSVLWAQPSALERGFLVTEVIGKWVLETERPLSPHLLFGPLFSLDFKHPVAISAGLVAGAGATWWTTPRFGLVSDLSYRLLIGAEIEHVGAWAVGCSFRL